MKDVDWQVPSAPSTNLANLEIRSTNSHDVFESRQVNNRGLFGNGVSAETVVIVVTRARAHPSTANAGRILPLPEQVLRTPKRLASRYDLRGTHALIKIGCMHHQ